MAVGNGTTGAGAPLVGRAMLTRNVAKSEMDLGTIVFMYVGRSSPLDWRAETPLVSPGWWL